MAGLKKSYGLSTDIFLATLLNLWYFQNKKCFPWILFVPCGLLWLAPENKTQFILCYLQYTRRFDLNRICCWLNLSLSLLQSHCTAGLIRYDEVKMLVIYASSHTRYHIYDNVLNFPNKLWYDLLLVKLSLSLLLGRRGGLMVSALDSGASGPGSSPGWGHCVVSLGKTLYSHSASLHPGV